MLNRSVTYILVFLLASFIPMGNINKDLRKHYSFNDLFPLNSSDWDWVEKTLDSLSLRDKCAQMVFPYAYGRDTNEYRENYERLIHLVKDDNVGGILFLSGDLEHQTPLINKLQKISKLPLIISADFERGVGNRLEGAVDFPTNMAFTAAGNPFLDYLKGKITAQESRAIGVHQNYAPLVDVIHDYRNPIINTRSYSSNPNIVSIHSEAFLRGMHEGRMIATAKHFPGHGGTELDSHNELPLISLSRQELYKKDLSTFKNAINTGVRSIMVGHLDVPALSDTTGIPATFSYNIVTKLLKDELGFKGLIVTDALNMHAITKDYTQAETAVLAVKAGNDILLFPSDEEEMIDGLYHAVKKGEISESRIDESVKKILAAKKWLGLDKRRIVNLKKAEKVVKTRWHYRVAQETAEKSITLVKDDNNIIPIDPEKYYKIYSVSISDSKYETKDDQKLFEKKINDQLGYVKNYRFNLNTTEHEYKKALHNLRKADLIILPLYVVVRSFQGTVDLQDDQLDFIEDIIDLNKPTIAISFGNPYLLREIQNVPAYIAAYGGISVSQDAAVNAILGNVKIEGKLPVSIPDTEFHLGFGLKSNNKGLFFQPMPVDTNYNFTQVDSLMNNALEDSVFPGAVLLIGHRNRVIYEKSFGHFTYNKKSKKVDLNSIFDLASLTKVVATTSSIMKLYDEGKIKLDDKVIKYLPEFNNNGKDKITIKNLLLHNSGLPAWQPFYKECSTANEVVNAIMNIDLDFSPGTRYQYSDLGMITLQQIIQKITHEGLDKFADSTIFKPLKMNHTFYNPSPKVWYNCLPTENDNYWRMQQMKGKVHDETAYLLNGVSGHAGLFSTGPDLAKLVYTLLNNGKYDSLQLFDSSTVSLFTTRYSDKSSRALGWDTRADSSSSAGLYFSENSFGHTGFTGTSIWADKNKGLFVILLTNRVYPSRKNRKIIDFRPILHNTIYKCVSYY